MFALAWKVGPAGRAFLRLFFRKDEPSGDDRIGPEMEAVAHLGLIHGAVHPEFFTGGKQVSGGANVIRDAEGLHARPAGLLVKLAQGFSCTIQLSANGKSADAKRLFAVMKLAAKCGQELRINVEGPDETAAARALEEFCAKEL